MKKISFRSILLATLLILLVALPGVLPYSLILPHVKTSLSNHVQGQVNIDSMSFSYLPTPQFSLHTISIDSPEQAHIQQAIIPVTARNILSLGRALYGINLINAVVTPQFASKLATRLQPQTPAIRIDAMSLENVSIKLEQGPLGPFSAQLAFNKNNQIETLDIHSLDNKAQLQIQPSGPDQFKILFSADHWTPPFAHPVNFEYVQLSGEANSSGMIISEIRAGLYNGLITGKGELSWNNHWQLNGRIEAKNIRAEPFIAIFSPKTRATGILRGEGTFQYQSEHFVQLLDTPVLQGSFSIQDGILHNIDLITPLKTPLENKVQLGGQTRFDQFSGVLSARGHSVNLRKLQLDAGKFHATGELSIRNEQIFGGTHTSLNAGALRATSQARLSGTLDHAELHPGDTWRPLTE